MHFFLGHSIEIVLFNYVFCWYMCCPNMLGGCSFVLLVYAFVVVSDKLLANPSLLEQKLGALLRQKGDSTVLNVSEMQNQL